MEDEVPYNNDNFYPINNQNTNHYRFMNTQAVKDSKNSKRPQSANIRITKDRGSKNKLFKRSRPNRDFAYTVAEEGMTAASAPEDRHTMAAPNAFRESLPTNPSQFTNSPSKFQKRLLLLEKKKKRYNGALNQDKEALYEEAMKNK